jgi:hypothetical protein
MISAPGQDPAGTHAAPPHRSPAGLELVPRKTNSARALDALAVAVQIYEYKRAQATGEHFIADSEVYKILVVSGVLSAASIFVGFTLLQRRRRGGKDSRPNPVRHMYCSLPVGRRMMRRMRVGVDAG